MIDALQLLLILSFTAVSSLFGLAAAQLESIALNAANSPQALSMIAYDVVIDPADNSIYLVYENGEGAGNIAVEKKIIDGSQKTAWLQFYGAANSSISNKVVHYDAKFHGGNSWLDTGNGSRDLFVLTFNSGEGYSLWQLNHRSGQVANRISFNLPSTLAAIFPAGLAGNDQYLFYGLNQQPISSDPAQRQCRLARFRKDFSQPAPEILTLEFDGGKSCEISAITINGKWLFATGSIGLDSERKLMILKILISDSVDFLSTPAVRVLRPPSGVGYAIALDPGRNSIYIAGRDTDISRLNRAVWQFSMNTLARIAINYDSSSSVDWAAFYFAAVHRSGDLYVGGVVGTTSTMADLLVYPVDRSKPVLRVSNSQQSLGGYSARFNVNNYAFYIAGNAVDGINVPRLYLYEGICVLVN